MASGQPGPAIDSLAGLLGRWRAEGLSDGQLLDRFVAARDEAAFLALLQRHGPMVLGVCRRILGDAHDADDAFQAAFLVLVRKAGSIGKRESVGAWLYGVACRTASRARVVRARRHRRESPGVNDVAANDPPPDLLWRDLRPVLDEEIGRLPEKFRAPFVLCYLEGKTNEEAARELGCPRGTLLSRLARARERLRARLLGRGIGLAAVALALGLSREAASAAVPPSLVTATAHAALAVLAGPATAGAVPASVSALTEGVVRTMFLKKLCVAGAVLVALGALVIGLGTAPVLLYFAARGVARARAAQPAPPPPLMPLPPQDVLPAAEPAQDRPDVPARVTFIEKQDGKPPSRTFHVGLTLRNRRDEPVWFLLPYDGDRPMPADGQFKNTGGTALPLEGEAYDGDKVGGQGRAVEVTFLGDGFHAFRLPPAGSLTIADYPLECWSDVRRVEVWEASELRVNGRTPLEDWLPYKTLSNARTVIPFWTNWRRGGSLDWDGARSRPRTDYPKEQVDFIAARVLKKWDLALHEPDAAALAKVRAVRVDLRDMQGTWKVVAHEKNGEAVPPEELKREYVTVTGQSIKLPQAEGPFSIDPTADPKEFTLKVVGAMKANAAREGIYQVERGRLKICLSLSLEEGMRPWEFAGKRGYEYLLLEPSPP
jgi:RNA polymerase sigma factor (sigma-70 family)